MREEVWEAILTTIGIIAVVAIVVGALYFGTMNSKQIDREQMTVCVESEGQWIQGNCVK